MIFFLLLFTTVCLMTTFIAAVDIADAGLRSTNQRDYDVALLVGTIGLFLSLVGLHALFGR